MTPHSTEQLFIRSHLANIVIHWSSLVLIVQLHFEDRMLGDILDTPPLVPHGVEGS
jgi:hypothetical protein